MKRSNMADLEILEALLPDFTGLDIQIPMKASKTVNRFSTNEIRNPVCIPIYG